MNYKLKSALYFATLVIAAIMYYNMGNTVDIQKNEFANNTIANVSSSEALN